MKKYSPLLLALTAALVLTSCTSAKSSSREEMIEPYALSEDQQEVIDILGLSNQTSILSFRAPQEAENLQVCVYFLDENGQWIEYGGGWTLSRGEEWDDPLEGTLAFRFYHDKSIDLNISCMGQAFYQVPPPEELEWSSPSASAKILLPDAQEITLEKEIPVALLATTSGTVIRTLDLNCFFSPEDLSGFDLVQVVTVQFSAEA